MTTKEMNKSAGGCPRCGGPLGSRPALSRFSDCKVCGDCGLFEALIVFRNAMRNGRGTE